MSFKTEMREFMSKLESWITGQQNVVTSLRALIDEQKDMIKYLRQDNRDLMNRLMSKNFEEYTMGSPDDIVSPFEVSPKSEPTEATEYLAGEIVEDEIE